MFKRLNDLQVEEKRVLLRTDYDVPLISGKVVDDTRLQASLQTIKALIERKVKKITILCHIDRPGGKVVESLRVEPVALHLRKLLPKDAPVVVEENLRFNPEEVENDIGFAEELAKKGDIYINDAFAVSHRNHASIVSLPKLLPSAIGIHFQEELKALKKVLDNPRRPVLFVIGGAKPETKLSLLEKLTNIADEILVGGKLAHDVGNACSPETMACITVAQLTQDRKDITRASANAFAKKISQAGTVVWNGPMGVYEEDETSLGTKIIAQAVNASYAFTVIGGGDTEAAATKFDAESGLDHISMGGGAMLQYLEDSTLPGLEAIKGGSR